MYFWPIFEAYVREYPTQIWSYMVQYLHFRILEFPLIEMRMKNGQAIEKISNSSNIMKLA